MGYGEEIDHLEASNADSTLGDLQSTVVGSPIFIQRFRQYLDILYTREVAPNFTVMTADKDDPRFDEFYISGNEIRLFIAFLLSDMPTYMALGFQSRNVHYQPAPNEHYTKLYVFQIDKGSKATSGPYIWGKNGALYHRLTKLKLFADSIWNQIKHQSVQWLIYPDATGFNKVIAWTQKQNPNYIFIANLDTEKGTENVAIPKISSNLVSNLIFQFSTSDIIHVDLIFNGKYYGGLNLEKGEGCVYQVQHDTL